MKNWMAQDFKKAFDQRDASALSRAITLVESKLPEHQALAQELLSVLPKKATAMRIGISGTPGVGKSTFIESFGLMLTAKKKRVAVLAVDPTSQVSGGSILGDKTRMELLSREPLAFIRPSPSGGALGGVARRTREVVQLCESFGFDLILIETVGVGQSETAVSRLTDCFMMLLQPGAGDSLQGIKRGILELVDIVVVTKADGASKLAAETASGHYREALHVLRHEGWHPPVIPTSALENKGLDEVWMQIEKYFAHLGTGITGKRQEQGLFWLEESLEEGLKDWFLQKVPGTFFEEIKSNVKNGKMTVSEALRELMKQIEK